MLLLCATQVWKWQLNYSSLDGWRCLRCLAKLLQVICKWVVVFYTELLWIYKSSKCRHNEGDWRGWGGQFPSFLITIMFHYHFIQPAIYWSQTLLNYTLVIILYRAAVIHTKMSQALKWQADPDQKKINTFFWWRLFKHSWSDLSEHSRDDDTTSWEGSKQLNSHPAAGDQNLESSCLSFGGFMSDVSVL